MTVLCHISRSWKAVVVVELDVVLELVVLDVEVVELVVLLDDVVVIAIVLLCLH